MIKSMILLISNLLHILLTLYVYMIIARAVISWLNPDPTHPAVRFLHRITEPLLAPVRKLLPPIVGLDLSPVLIIMAIYLIDRILVSTLRSFAYLN
ncbi:MAG: YggT family protein [Calditrichaeota bacterium]|nr:MAG: YggT family protein [Calditrichota bacterium]